MLVRWDPLRELFDYDFFEPFEELDNGNSGNVFHPRADIIEDKDGYRIVMELPGVTQKDVKLTVHEGVLTVSGEVVREELGEDSRYRMCERCHGTISRSFLLPDEVDGDKIEARLKDGLLTIQLPKKETAKPREIPIGVSAGK